ncbi:hypothetical protein EJ05DRAFT_420984, partial [Pseudovirgaria hyperparasitica]
LILILGAGAWADVRRGDGSICDCGFRDSSSGNIFTDGMVTFFNESSTFDDGWIVQSYKNKKEKGWNSVFRQGATPNNVYLDSSSDSAQLYIDPFLKNHLVMGSSIQTDRRDIMFGSFRAKMKPPGMDNGGGSALSMLLQMNDTQSMEFMLMNTDIPNDSYAWVGTFVNGEFPDRNLGSNFSVLANGSKEIGIESPWNFTEYKIDWDATTLNFTIGSNTTRRVVKAKQPDLPAVPVPFEIKHWSTGNYYSMQGPPTKRGFAGVEWVRMFFNSTTTDARDFDARCIPSLACSVDDTTLRGVSSYNATALEKYEHKHPKEPKRVPAIVIAVFCLSVSFLVLCHAIYIWEPWKLVREPSSRSTSRTDVPTHSPLGTPMISPIGTPLISPHERSLAEDYLTLNDGNIEDDTMTKDQIRNSEAASSVEQAGPEPVKKPLNEAKRARVDYLAGIVAFCAVIVTVQHFCLSFVPAAISPGDRVVHHSSENFVRMYVSPVILSQLWLGLFFTSSCRFMVDRYLEDGDLRHIASVAVRRIPRFMIPVTAIVLIEYFLIDAGATRFLQYTPSITWSQWPYVERFPSFAIFLNEMLELGFLIPNGFPQIVFHYCTGVLWTVAVQLQSTWLILLSILVIREIRNPWKRMSFYAFCIVNGWYAQSWNAYFYVGILLSDLDITYKYRKYLHSHLWVYYPLVTTCTLLAIGAVVSNITPQLTKFNLSVSENGWHPDWATASPVTQTKGSQYPEYFVPRLNGLIAASSLQTIIEISPFMQMILSNRVLQTIFPHIFTIYLIHGVIFWSWGSWLLVFLTDHNFSYDVSVTLVGVTSYAILGLVVPILTPMTDVLGMDLARHWWAFASQIQPPKRSTMFPFPDNLLRNR